MRTEEGLAVVLTGKIESAQETKRVLLIGIEIGGTAVSFIGRLLIVVAKTEVQLQARCDAIVILHESGKRIASLRLSDIGSNTGGTDGAQDEVGVGTSVSAGRLRIIGEGGGEVKSSGRIRSLIVITVHEAVFHTHFNSVRAFHDGDCVIEVPSKRATESDHTGAEGCIAIADEREDRIRHVCWES